MKLLEHISNKFLSGRFLLVAAAAGILASAAIETGRKHFSKPVDPEKDRITAVFSGPDDPVLKKPYYGMAENEIAWSQRHHEMMKDTANVKELKAWLSRLDPVLNATPMEKIKAVHSFVQGYIRYSYDTRLYGRNYVAPPLQTIRAKFGDCDDFAAVFYTCLRYVGFPDNKCFELICATEPGRVGDHRIVLVDTSGQEEKRLLSKNMFVLDNGGPIKHLENTTFIPGVLINRSGSRLVQEGLDSITNEVKREIKRQGLREYIREAQQ